MALGPVQSHPAPSHHSPNPAHPNAFARAPACLQLVFSGMVFKNKDRKKDVFYHITTTVVMIAALAYLVMALGHSAISTSTGRAFMWVRYADWAFTTPLLLIDLGLLAGVSLSETYYIVICDLLMIIAGFAAAVSTGANATWPLFIFGAWGGRRVFTQAATADRHDVISRCLLAHPSSHDIPPPPLLSVPNRHDCVRAHPALPHCEAARACTQGRQGCLNQAVVADHCPVERLPHRLGLWRGRQPHFARRRDCVLCHPGCDVSACAVHDAAKPLAESGGRTQLTTLFATHARPPPPPTIRRSAKCGFGFILLSSHDALEAAPGVVAADAGYEGHELLQSGD